MRFFFDNCLTIRLVRGLREFEDRRSVELLHLSERFDPAAKDTEWLPELSQERDWIIMSGDGKMRRSPEERLAWLQAGLTSYFFSPRFTNQTGFGQVEELIHWWRTVRLHSKTAPRGSAYRLRWREKTPFAMELRDIS